MNSGDTVFLVKYWASKGVEEITDADVRDDGYVSINKYLSLFKLGRDVFTTRADAVYAAKKLRDKEVALLVMRAAKYREMTFEDDE